MKHDPYNIVIDMLRVIKEKVLLNRSIDKSLKVQLFNNTTLKHLFGFNSWTVPFQDGEGTPLPNLDEAKSSLASEICSFLKLVVCSFEYGILVLPGASVQRPLNGHVLDIIKEFQTSDFKCKELRDVVSSALAQCPELASEYANKMRSPFSHVDHEEYHHLLKVLVDMVSSLSVDKLAGKDVDYCLAALIPAPLDSAYVKNILSGQWVKSEAKFTALQFVEANMAKTSSLVEALNANRKNAQADKIFEKVKRFALNCLPPINSIKTFWNEALNSESMSTKEKIAKMDHIAKLFGHISEWAPSPQFANKIKPEQMLSDIQLMDAEEDVKLPLIITCLCLVSSLQSKFEVLRQAKDGVLHKELFTTIEVLLDFYIKIDCTSELGQKKSKHISSTLEEHIKKTLMNYGFSQTEADIKVWLESLMGCGASTVQTVCNAIVTTIANLETYYDQVVVITSNAVSQNSQSSAVSLKFLGNAQIVDSTNICAANVPLSFSRMVLGFLDVMQNYSDEDFHQYFCRAIKKYILDVAEPQILAQYLLSREINFLSELPLHCKCWLGEALPEKTQESPGESINEKVDYIFFTKSFKDVDAILEKASLPEDATFHLEILKRILLCLQIDTSGNASVEKIKASDAYCKLLKWFLNEVAESEGILTFYEKVLNHPTIFNGYDPFTRNYYASFVEEIISTLIAVDKTNKNIVSYFKQMCFQLKLFLETHQDLKDSDFLTGFSVFLDDEKLVPEELLESLVDLYQIILQAPREKFLQSQSLSHLGTKVAVAVKMHVNTHSKPLVSYMWTHLTNKMDVALFDPVAVEENLPLASLLKFYQSVISCLAKAMDSSDIELLEKSDIRWLVSCSSVTGCDLVERILHDQPNYISFTIKTFKKMSSLSAGAAPILHKILNEGLADEAFASEVLEKLKKPVVDWLLDYNSPSSPTLFSFLKKLHENNSLNTKDIFEPVEIVQNKLLVEKEMPPNHLIAICWLCESLKGHKKESKLSAGDALLTSLHFLLTAIGKIYGKKVTNESLLSAAVDHCDELLIKLGRRTRPDKAESSIWNKFVGKIIKYSLKDSSIYGPLVLKCLRTLCQFQYSQSASGTDFSIRDLHATLISHPNFDSVMLSSRASQLYDLKESIILLQLEVLKLCPAAAKDLSARKLLACYSATTLPHDQAMLELLHEYEVIGAMRDTVPVCWGSFAEEFFGTNDEDELPVPQLGRIIGALNDSQLFSACVNFDRNVSLDLKKRCVYDQTKAPMYDIRFILPVVSYVADAFLLTKALPRDADAAKMLCVAVSSLCAKNCIFRSQAIGVLRTIRSMYDICTFPNVKKYWQWFIDIICYSLASAAQQSVQSLEGLKKTKKRKVQEAAEKSVEIKTRGVPLTGPVSRFLLEALLMNEFAIHPLYKIVQNYIFLFPTIKMYQVSLQLSHRLCHQIAFFFFFQENFI